MLDAVVAGVVGSLVASTIAFFAVRKVTPRIEIADEFMRDNRIRLKIVNRRKRDAVDVRVELALRRVTTDGFTADPIELSKPAALVLSRYSADDSDAKYARRITVKADLDEIWDDETGYLHFRVYALDAFSGFGKLFEKSFRRKSCVVNGRYEKGLSLRVAQAQTAVRVQGVPPPLPPNPSKKARIWGWGCLRRPKSEQARTGSGSSPRYSLLHALNELMNEGDPFEYRSFATPREYGHLG